MKSILKRLVFGLGMLLTAPAWLLVGIEKRLTRSTEMFSFFGQALSLVPGLVGMYLRGAFYFCTLDQCAWDVHIGFGSVFVSPGARVASRVSTGLFCVFGLADIGSGTRIASRVSVPSGKHQHFDKDGALYDGTRYSVVRIGSYCWIGEGAVILDELGDEVVVSAGCVVVNPVPANSLVGGNPGRVLKDIVAARESTEDRG